MPKTCNKITNKNLILDYTRKLKIEPKTYVNKSKIRLKQCILSHFNSSLNPEIIIKNKLGLWHLKWCSKTNLWYEIYDNNTLSISGYQISNYDSSDKLKIKTKTEKPIKKSKYKINNKNKGKKDTCKRNKFFDDPKIITMDNFEILKIGTVLQVFQKNNISKPVQYNVVELYNNKNYGTLIKLNYNGYIMHLIYNDIGKNWIQLDIYNDYKRTNNIYYLKILKSNLEMLLNIAEKNLTYNT